MEERQENEERKGRQSCRREVGDESGKKTICNKDNESAEVREQSHGIPTSPEGSTNEAAGQRAGPARRPAWLAGEESDPTGCDFVRDGRSMPPALTEHTTCPGLGLIYY